MNRNDPLPNNQRHIMEVASREEHPVSASFRNADELEALLLQAGAATPMTAERKARIYGNLE